MSTTTNALSVEQLAEKLNGKLWVKGDLKRIYLDCGYNTKKMSTKTYVYQREDGSFDVSCYIDCPSQPYQWIKSQQEEIINSVSQSIEQAQSETVYILTNNEDVPVGWDGKPRQLNEACCYYTKDQAVKELDNCSSYDKYITMPRDEFDTEVARLDEILKSDRVKEKDLQKIQIYGVGTVVSHSKFKAGIVIAEDNTFIEVDFVSVGVKKFTKEYIKLEKITTND